MGYNCRVGVRGACGAFLIGGLAAGLAVPALAQDGGAQQQAPQQLQEVVVTAQKTRQTLEQVPASVSSIGGDYIRDIGVRNFEELGSYTANTNLQVSTSSTQLLVRGFGTLNDVPGLDPSVGVVVDGVVYAYPEYLASMLYDLDRYEVLRGPQGTLFGKNVTAGILNITTNAPDQHSLIHVEGGWRSYGDEVYQPVVNLPLGGGWSVRAAGNFDHNDRGQFWNTDLNRPEMNPLQDGGRLRVRYDNGDNWSMDLGAWVSYQAQNFNQHELFIDQPHMKALDQQYDPRFTGSVGDFLSEDVPSTQNSTARGASVTFNGDFGNPGGMESLHLIAITGIAENVIGARDIDADFSPVPFIRDTLVKPEPERQLTQELRVTGIAPDLFGLGHDANFVAGLYFDDYSLNTSDNFSIEDLGATLNYILAAKEDNHSAALPYYYIPAVNLVPVTTPPPPCSVPGLLNLSTTPGVGLDCVLGLLQGLTGQPLIPAQNAQSGLNERTMDYAAFGQGEWFFTNKWSLILGLRFAKEDRAGDPHSQSTSEIIKAIADQVNFSESLHRVETDFSPKIGVKYQPGKHTEAYFTWAEGYKSGRLQRHPAQPHRRRIPAGERAQLRGRLQDQGLPVRRPDPRQHLFLPHRFRQPPGVHLRRHQRGGGERGGGALAGLRERLPVADAGARPVAARFRRLRRRALHPVSLRPRARRRQVQEVLAGPEHEPDGHHLRPDRRAPAVRAGVDHGADPGLHPGAALVAGGYRRGGHPLPGQPLPEPRGRRPRPAGVHPAVHSAGDRGRRHRLLVGVLRHP